MQRYLSSQDIGIGINCNTNHIQDTSRIPGYPAGKSRRIGTYYRITGTLKHRFDGPGFKDNVRFFQNEPTPKQPELVNSARTRVISSRSQGIPSSRSTSSVVSQDPTALAVPDTHRSNTSSEHLTSRFTTQYMKDYPLNRGLHKLRIAGKEQSCNDLERKYFGTNH
jgi:hypothetical protein